MAMTDNRSGTAQDDQDHHSLPANRKIRGSLRLPAGKAGVRERGERLKTGFVLFHPGQFKRNRAFAHTYQRSNHNGDHNNDGTVTEPHDSVKTWISLLHWVR